VKILVDSCVWSLLLRRRNKSTLSQNEQVMRTSLTQAIEDGQVVIIGPIRQEVLSGIKDPAQFEKLRGALETFPDEQLTTSDYEEAARLFNLCRRRGVECGSTDILICSVAVQRRWNILSNDRGLHRCMEAIRTEGLAL